MSIMSGSVYIQEKTWDLWQDLSSRNKSFIFFSVIRTEQKYYMVSSISWTKSLLAYSMKCCELITLTLQAMFMIRRGDVTSKW